jgi:ectoine hydroxylase
VPAPLAFNLHVLLDAVNEFNGPLIFIRGSHRYGPVPATFDAEITSYPFWTVHNATVAALVAKGGMFAAKGSPGAVLIFGDSLVHGSPANMSPWPRRIFSMIVNPLSNALTRHRRPDYQHRRGLTPVTGLADDCLGPAVPA